MTTNNEIRRKFLLLLGSTYKEYGMSANLGWIEGILGLEDQELMQAEISEALRDIMGNEKLGTSISSVNRALRVLKNYGAIKESGSAKIGFKYRISMEYDFFEIFMQSFLRLNKKALRSLKKMHKEAIAVSEDNLLDEQLINAIKNEITYMQLMDEYLVQCIQLLKNIKEKSATDF